MTALQDLYSPNGLCFGCGPKNSQGLMLKSEAMGDKVVAHFYPKDHYKAFDNVLSGGICGAVLDCHSNWCAAYFIMTKREEDFPPCTVTAKYSVDLLYPTPMGIELKIVAIPQSISINKAEIKAHIIAGEKITATCTGLFVAVKPGHPAYHRW